MTTTTAPPPTVAAQVRSASAALSVADLEAAVSWYGRAFGFTPTTTADLPQFGARVVYLRRGELVLELVEMDRAVGDPRPMPPENYALRGIAQLAFYVDDVHAAHRAALAERLPVVSDVVEAPALGVAVFYLQDLDGNHIEIAAHTWTDGGRDA